MTIEHMPDGTKQFTNAEGVVTKHADFSAVLHYSTPRQASGWPMTCRRVPHLRLLAALLPRPRQAKRTQSSFTRSVAAMSAWPELARLRGSHDEPRPPD